MAKTQENRLAIAIDQAEQMFGVRIRREYAKGYEMEY